MDSTPMTLLDSVTVDDSSSDTQLHVAAWLITDLFAWGSATISTVVNTLDGTSPNAKIFALQVEGADSAQTDTVSDTTQARKLTTSHTADTDHESDLDPPDPTFWPLNPAAPAQQPSLINGWTSARARYHLLARHGTVYTTDDAVRKRIDGAVHKYLDRAIKATENYDYSIGDLEGFILGQSRLGYVAM
jgi:hypothetical protein